MTIASLPAPPARSDTAETFVSRADSFLAALPQFATDLNAWAASINGAIAALTSGTALSFAYTFGGTAGGDPGSNGLRFNNATYASVTTITMSCTAGSDVTALLDTMSAGNNTVKGYLRVFITATPTTYALYAVTAVSGSGTYRSATVTYVAGSGTLSGSITAAFSRAGDAGQMSPAVGNTTLTGIKGLEYNSEISTTPSASAAAINWANGHQQKIAAGALTSITYSTPGGSPCRLQLRIAAYASPAAISFPATVKWLGASFTTPTTNKETLIDIFWDGTYYWSRALVQV